MTTSVGMSVRAIAGPSRTSTIAVANVAIPLGKALFTTNKGLVAVATSDVPLVGLSLNTVIPGGSVNMQVIGPIDPTIANLGAGVAGPVGIDATGSPKRATDPSCISTQHFLGVCDTDGILTVGCGGVPGSTGPQGPPGPAAASRMVTGAAIPKGSAVITSGANVALATQANLALVRSFAGVAVANGVAGAPVSVQSAGLLDLSINVGAGIADDVGTNAAGLLVRGTDPTCTSKPLLIGTCDTAGAITLGTDSPFSVSSVVWKPGVTARGVYPTFAAALAVVQMVTVGPAAIGIDDSSGPANIDPAGMPAGGWDSDGRIGWVNANRSSSFPGSTVNILDGAQIKNWPGAAQLYIAPVPGASGLPSFVYTQNMFVSFEHNVVFDTSGATISPVSVAAGVNIEALVDTFSTIVTGPVGAETFNLLGAGAFLRLIVGSEGRVVPPQNIVKGGAGTTFAFTRCRTSSAVVTTAAFTGTVSVFALLEGPIIDRKVAIGGAVAYVVDAAAIAGSSLFDGQILCKPTVDNVTEIKLPNPALPMNLGRVIPIADVNGLSQQSPIKLTPFGATTLNGVNASLFLQGAWGEWVARCDGAQWASLPATGSRVVGTLGAQSLESPKFTVVATTVAAAAQIVDTTYKPANSVGVMLGGKWVGVDRTIGAQVVRGGRVSATLRMSSAGVLTIAAQAFLDGNGDAALATAVPSLQVTAGNTLQVTFTPPIAYGTNIDWRFDLETTED